MLHVQRKMHKAAVGLQGWDWIEQHASIPAARDLSQAQVDLKPVV